MPASACALGLNRLANVHSRERLESGTSDRPSPEINHVARNHPPYHLNFASHRPYSSGWGYYPSGGIGLVLVIIVILPLMGRI